MLCAASIYALASCNSESSQHQHEENEEQHDHGHEGHEHGHEHEGHDHERHDHEHEGHDHGHEHEGHEKESHAHGSDDIVLSPEVAARFGVATDTALIGQFGHVVKAGGIVTAAAEGSAVVSAPTSGIIRIAGGINTGSNVRSGQIIGLVRADGISGGDTNRAAKVELDAAKAELDRLESLYADRLVTVSQLNAAKAAYERAKAAYSASAAGGAATSPIAGVITALNVQTGQYVATGDPIATVASSDRLTLRAEVPFKLYRQAADATDARIVIPYSGMTYTLSQLDGRRTASDNQSAAAAGGYVPVTFTLRNDGTIIPGSAVEVYLMASGTRQCITVPVAALTEQQGAFFVYEKLHDDCYRKVAVTTGTSDGERVEITSGLHGGENIVCSGVTAVKLAGASGAVPAGHSHSH